MSQEVEEAVVDLDEIGEKYEKGYFRRLSDMMTGLKMPHDSREYKLARIELQRQAAPLVAIVTVVMFVIVLIVVTAIQAEKKEVIEVQITDINGKIANLTESTNAQTDIEIGDELTNTLERCKQIYQMIRDYMTEIFNGSASNMYAIHSTAYGKTPGFIQQNLKYILIGLVVGAILACGCWFMSGLITEVKRGKHFDEPETEANV